ncbi:MAG: CHAP domain-containing protein [Ktedonobacterales bacterium]
MRRLRADDMAVVAATTRILSVVEPVGVERALTEVDPTAAREPVTIVAAAVGAMPLSRAGVRSPHRPASRLKLAMLWSLAAACMFGVLYTALPLTGHPLPSYSSHLPHLDDSGHFEAPTGPWATGSGVTTTLGLGGGAAPGVKAPGSAGATVSKQAQTSAQSHSSGQPAASGGTGIAPAPFQPWPPANAFMYVAGHPAFGVSDANGYYWWAFGQCTWWAQYKKQNENLTRMGSARYWAAGAAARGYRVGGSPVAGATVVFQAGVQGAGGDGHVAHVEAVYPSGWFLVSEMNFYANGGGWGRVDYRYAHTGWGVSFIY